MKAPEPVRARKHESVIGPKPKGSLRSPAPRSHAPTLSRSHPPAQPARAARRRATGAGPQARRIAGQPTSSGAPRSQDESPRIRPARPAAPGKRRRRPAKTGERGRGWDVEPARPSESARVGAWKRGSVKSQTLSPRLSRSHSPTLSRSHAFPPPSSRAPRPKSRAGAGEPASQLGIPPPRRRREDGRRCAVPLRATQATR